MFENFPYTNFHELNLDWIIKIAKDFLDQYTHIQEVIETGEQSLLDKTDDGLTQLQEKADNLETALQNLYNDYSEQMASQLADALEDLNTWYTQHQGYLDNILITNTQQFQQNASEIGQAVLDSIPSEYGEVTNVLKAIPAELQYENPVSSWAYFYGYGYFNANLEYTENSGIALLKIPLEAGEFVILASPSDFMVNITGTYRFTYELNDGTLTRTTPSQYYFNPNHTDGEYESAAFGFGNTKYVYITINPDKVAVVKIKKDKALYCNRNGYKYPTGIYRMDTYNTVSSQIFFSDTSISIVTTSSALWKRVNTGDVINNIILIEGISYYGAFLSKDGTVREKITSGSFTVPKDGFICVFNSPTTPQTATYVPVNRFKLMPGDIIGSEAESEYDGLQAVAFGTSLTYRSETTGGYLDYLPSLSGMVIDNQGIGSGKIKMDILNRIRSYTGYSGKRVAILEGFCNDFGYNAASLGVYTDNTDATVCGCVRQALTYILTQNRDITIFLVLDHYGQDYNDVNSSSTAVNSAGMTQYQYYNEIEKIAESLGIIVIPLYKISGMNENTPQYFIDNIHPSTLGAMQTAYAIWAAMKQHYPNRVQ